jgi:2-dehydropantoate 2-reductase
MRLLIWGAGAIGGTIGAYLARAGHQVTLVDRVARHVDAINSTGLRITGPIDEFTVRAPAFTPQAITGEFGSVLLCVKAHDTPAATQALVPHLAADGYVVSLQNGLNELVIARIAGEERTVGAFINFGADYMEPGVIHHGGRGAVVLGELDGQVTSRVQALHQTFLGFDDRAIITSNIWGYLWGKLVYGTLLLATALTNEPIADALAMQAYRGLYVALAREVLSVALARNVRPEGFDGFEPQAYLPDAEAGAADRSLDDLVAFNLRSAKTHSGIWRDLAVRKRKTEVDAQLGPIVTLGAEAGVSTPLTARLLELVHEIETGERALDLTNLDVLQESK